MKTIQMLLEQASINENNSSVSKSETHFSNQEEIRQRFTEYKKCLLDLTCWNKAGNLSSYQHFKENGEKTDDKISENSLIRISLKGTGKYNWVKVVGLTDNEDEFILTFQPTYDPTAENPKIVSHFFTAEARNNFCLQLKDTKIVFYIIGLNEKQNLAPTSDFVEAIRNWVTANVGSYLGLQREEWTTFAQNFLQLIKKKQQA